MTNIESTDGARGKRRTAIGGEPLRRTQPALSITLESRKSHRRLRTAQAGHSVSRPSDVRKPVAKRGGMASGLRTDDHREALVTLALTRRPGTPPGFRGSTRAPGLEPSAQ